MVSVHCEIDRLTGLHVLDLGFLQVGRDPDVVERHHAHERLTRLYELAQLVQPGQPLMSVVPLDDVWITANLKETEIENVKPGEPVDFTVDAYHGLHFRGHVQSLSPATGARFSLLPPDNATGNFTKVVQRVPV